MRYLCRKILVSGGARSGKSEFAESLIENEKNLYIATSVPFDSEMKKRVELHKKRRGDNWNTAEIYRNFEKIEDREEFKNSENIFLDCITIMITNIMMDTISENLENQKSEDYEITLEDAEIIEDITMREIETLFRLAENNKKNLIIVTNEVGLGIVPENRMSRIFRDIAGRVNRFAAEKSDEVYMVFMGIPNRIR